MTILHKFKRVSQKLAIKMHKAMNPAERFEPTDFEYETLDHFEIPFVAWGEHSWKIVKVIRPMFS